MADAGSNSADCISWSWFDMKRDERGAGRLKLGSMPALVSGVG
jgi:hypothetical protein